jgi:hypothetical protein
VLSAAGYSVATATNQYAGGATTALLGSLTAYDAVFWSATGNGTGDFNSNPTMFANLTNYVSNGGRVFVTGYDSIASPNDFTLQNFLGGSGSVDTCGTPGTVAIVANSLTTGAVNIMGQTPGTTGNQTCDRDGLANLTLDTVGIVSDSSFPGFYQWTLRSVGLGEIAYVSNGNYSGISQSTMWSDGSAYNAAVLNFAYNASQQVPEPATIALFGLGLLGFAASRRKRR